MPFYTMPSFYLTLEEAQEHFWQMTGVEDAAPGTTAEGWTLEADVLVVSEDGEAPTYAVYDAPRGVMLSIAGGAR